jgi:CAAD domains of cyanobacterial aminoacyl-tRNA synthetase
LIWQESLYLLESLQTYIQFDREAMNAKDEAPNSPEVQDGKEPLIDTTSPTAAPETTSEPASAPPEVEKAPAAEVADQATDTTDTASEASASTPPEPSTPASEQIAQQVKDFAAKLIQQMQSSFSVEQKSAVVVVALVVVAIPVIILANKVLNVIDSIPLLEPILELVGLVYTIWFVYRYLIFAQSRKELIDGITGIKSKIMGDGKSA